MRPEAGLRAMPYAAMPLVLPAAANSVEGGRHAENAFLR
jgi:hypothetical protein